MANIRVEVPEDFDFETYINGYQGIMIVYKIYATIFLLNVIN